MAPPQTGTAAGPPPNFVKTHTRQRLADNPNVTAAAASSSSSSSSSVRGDVCMYDAIVAGGTLGVFVAVALAQQGWRVAVVERGKLAGRTQEWNISRKELMELVEVRRGGGAGGGRRGGEMGGRRRRRRRRRRVSMRAGVCMCWGVGVGGLGQEEGLREEAAASGYGVEMAGQG